MSFFTRTSEGHHPLTFVRQQLAGSIDLASSNRVPHVDVEVALYSQTRQGWKVCGRLWPTGTPKLHWEDTLMQVSLPRIDGRQLRELRRLSIELDEG